VRVIITDGEQLRGGKWREIPEHVENVIVVGGMNRRYLNNRNRFDYMEEMVNYSEEYEELTGMINEMLEGGMRDEVNIHGKSILYYMIECEMYERVIDMIERGEFRKEIMMRPYSYEGRMVKNMFLLSMVCGRYIQQGRRGSMKKEMLKRIIMMMIDMMEEEVMNYEEEYYSVFGYVIETEDNEIIMRALNRMSNVGVLESEYHVWEKLEDEEMEYYETEQEEEEEIKRINRENERKREVKEAIRERIEQLRR
jgi:hypothetical protein